MRELCSCIFSGEIFIGPRDLEKDFTFDKSNFEVVEPEGDDGFVAELNPWPEAMVPETLRRLSNFDCCELEASCAPVWFVLNLPFNENDMVTVA